MDDGASREGVDSFSGSEALHEIRSGLLQLHAKTDAFFQAVQQRHASRMQCAPGCDACCQRMPSVFPVEAWFIAGAIQQGPDSAVDRLVRDLRAVEGRAEVTPCPMLDRRGRCRVYNARPILCRSHGVPVLLPEGRGRFDVCPLNFAQPGMRQSVSREDVLDTDRLNEILAVIDSLFRQAIPRGDSMPLRMPLAHGVLFFRKCDL